MLVKIVFDIAFGFFSRDVQLFRKSETAHAVYHAKVYRLGSASVQRRHLIVVQIEDSGSRISVNIISVVESLYQILVSGQMGQNTKLNL